MNGDGRLLCVVCLRLHVAVAGIAVTILDGQAVCGEHLDAAMEAALG